MENYNLSLNSHVMKRLIFKARLNKSTFYASQTWLPNKRKSEQREMVQKPATRWIPGTHIDYYEKSLQRKLWPPILYINVQGSA